MALNVKQGTIISPLATGNQVYTGIGFQPKAIILWSDAGTATGFQTDDQISFGFASGAAAQRCVNVFSVDGTSGSSSSGRKMVAGVYVDSNPSSTATQVRSSLVSFDTDGFTLNFDAVDGVAHTIHYLALGGSDITGAKVGEITAKTTTGTQAYTGVGFQPTALMLLGTGDTAALPAATTAKKFCLGMATSTTARGCLFVAGENGGSPPEAATYERVDKIYALASSAALTLQQEADLTSFDADGFTLNFTTVDGTAPRIFYLALRGGSYGVFNDTQKTSTGTKAKTGLGFQPGALLMASTGRAASTSLVTGGKVSLGAAAVPGVQGSVWSEGQKVNPTESNRRYSTSSALAIATGPSTINAEAALSSFDADGYTLNWTTADATAREFFGLAIGATASGGGGSAPTIGTTTANIQTATVTGNAQITISKPTGVVSGDLMVAHLIVDQNVTISTVPTGWTAAINNQWDGERQRTYVYEKVAGSSEPANYSWQTSAVGAAIAGAILRVVGADTTNPINQASGHSYVDALSFVSDSIVPTVNNTLILVLASADFLNADAPGTWSASGTTADHAVEESTNHYSIAGFHKTQASGASVNQTVGLSMTAGTGEPAVVCILAIAPSGAVTPPTSGVPAFKTLSTAVDSAGTRATGITFQTPAGTAANDVLLAHMSVEATQTITGIPSGWVLVESGADTGNRQMAYAFMKVATANEPASYTFSPSGGTYFAGAIMRISGADTLNPIGASEIAQDPSSPITSATITAPVNNCLIATLFSVDLTSPGSDDWQSPGAVEQYDFKEPSTDITIAGYTEEKLTAGNVSRSATLQTQTTIPATAIIIAIQPSGTTTSTTGTALPYRKLKKVGAGATPGGTPPPPPPPPPPPSGTGRVGFATNIRGASQATRLENMDRLNEGPAPWIREDFLWATIEPARGQFTGWGIWDNLMTDAASKGISICAIADYGTSWAGTPPTSNQDYADFCVAIAKRYNVVNGTFWAGKSLKIPAFAIEFWNEPWLTSGWGSTPNPQKYCDMVRTAAPQVRTAAPSVTTICAMHYIGAGIQFAKALLDYDVSLGGNTRIWQMVDCFSDHPYPGGSTAAAEDPYSTGPDSQQFRFDEIDLLHTLLVSYGATNHLWVTEIGWSTSGGNTSGNVPPVSEAQQSTYLTGALQRLFVEWTYVDRVIIYEFQDYASPGSTDGYGFFGVRRSDGSFKPSWNAIKNWISTHPG